MYQRSGHVSWLSPVSSLTTRTHRHGGVRQLYWKQMLLIRRSRRHYCAQPLRER